jgi:hypothetical protein
MFDTQLDPTSRFRFNGQRDIQPGLGFGRQPLTSLLGFPIDGTGSLLPETRPGGLLADGLRDACIGRCTDLVLLAPGGRRPFSWDQCMAHCEGRNPFKQVQPFIRFPSTVH